MSRVIGKAVQQTADIQVREADGELPELLEMLLPPRSYQGGASQEAVEVAEEERRVVSSIHQLLGALSKEKEALLFSLASQQVGTFALHLLSRLLQ